MFIKFLRFRTARARIRQLITDSLVEHKLSRPSFANEDLPTVLEMLPELFGYVLEGKELSETLQREFTKDDALNIAGGLVQMFFWIGISRNNVLKRELEAEDMVWAEIAAVAVQFHTIPNVVPMEFIDQAMDDFREGFKKHLGEKESPERAIKFSKMFDGLFPAEASSLFGFEQKMFSITPFPAP